MQLHHSKIVKAICRSALTIVTGSCLATALPVAASPQLIAENSTPTVQFYCGKATDLSSRSTLPATVVKVSGYEEEPVLIIWKSEAFGKFTPQQRCETVSPKIQAALQQGRYLIGSGIDKETGLGIVCAVANAEQTCDRNNMLFTLKSYQNAENAVEEIISLIKGDTGKPSYQSSGKQMPDLRQFASLRKK
jgi:Circadian oscillating protein COP23